MISQNVFRVRSVEIEKAPHKLAQGGWATDLLIDGEDETIRITLFSDFKKRIVIKKVEAIEPF